MVKTSTNHTAWNGHDGNITKNSLRTTDSSIGKGRITPEEGGDLLSFRKSDLKDAAKVPQQNDRYGYDVKNADDGKRYAINVHPQAAATRACPATGPRRAGRACAGGPKASSTISKSPIACS